MQYVSHSSYLVSIGAIARLIYIYETTVTHANFCPRLYQKLSQSTKIPKIFWGTCPQTPLEV